MMGATKEQQDGPFLIVSILIFIAIMLVIDFKVVGAMEGAAGWALEIPGLDLFGGFQF